MNDTKEKESGMLECAFNPIDDKIIKEVKWFRNDESEVKPSNDIIFTHTGRYLTFKSFNYNFHNGKYTCKVFLTNRQMIKSSNAVQILVKCEFLSSDSYDDLSS